jgi:hypothetical protein
MSNFSLQIWAMTERGMRLPIDTSEMVQLVASWRDKAGVIAVEVAAEPSSDVRPGVIVRPAGLTAVSWAMGNHSGLAFRAQRIELASTRR